MSVIYLLGSLNRGGTETLLLDVLRNSTTNVALVFRKGGTLEKELNDLPLPVFQLSPKFPFDILYFWKLRKLFLSQKCKIVHAHQPLDAFYAYAACVGTNIKIVLTFHGYDYDNKTIANWITNFIIIKTDINIFVSNHVKQYYTDKYQLKSKNFTLYNGIDTKKNSKKVGHKLRLEFDIQKETPVLGTVGNFNSVRDPLTICKFLNLLNQRRIRFHFFFVGAKNEIDSRLFENCYRYCQQNSLGSHVSFLGSRNDVPDILNELDAFIYSTDHDTFGIAVVEAMMAGTPVFVNDWQVMNEITENGKYAHIYQSKNEADLLIAFEAFMANQSLYKQAAKDNAEAVKEKYSIQNHILGLQKIYKNL